VTRRLFIVVAGVALAGCGGAAAPSGTDPGRLPPQAPGVGPGTRFRPPSLGSRAARALPVHGLRCSRVARPRFGVHLELFAARRVVLVAPGIGVAPPRVRRGAYVSGGRCSYPVRTREPTGVIEVDAARQLTLGQLFAVWGQPLSRTGMAGFRGRVSAYADGHRRPGDPGAIPLRRHAQIVVEVGGHVPPHAAYRFPPGL
jgi:hypothetical protein